MAIKGILKAWQADGVERPLLPLNVDIDGDGITDAYGLDADDNVILVSGVALENTVYLSEGDDVQDHPDEV